MTTRKSNDYKITAVCDNCGIEKLIQYNKYMIYIKNQNKYFCHKCSSIKTKKTNIEKYGVEFPMQNCEIKEKIKKRR